METLPAIIEHADSPALRGNILSNGGMTQRVMLSSPEINSGMVAHWRFDEGMGSETYDSQGNSGDAWIRSGVNWQSSHEDDFKYALSLDGESLSYVELGVGTTGDDDSLRTGSEITISGWFKSRKLTEGLRTLDFGTYENGVENNTIILSSSGDGSDANFTVSDGAGSQSIIVPDFWKLQQWQHLAISIDEDGLTNFFVDGQFKHSSIGKTPAQLKGPTILLEETDSGWIYSDQMMLMA